VNTRWALALCAALAVIAAPASAGFNNDGYFGAFDSWLATHDGAGANTPQQQKAVEKAKNLLLHNKTSRPDLACDLDSMSKMLKVLEKAYPADPTLVAAADESLDLVLWHISEHIAEANLLVKGKFDADNSNTPPEARKIESYVLAKWGNSFDKAETAADDGAHWKRPLFLGKALRGLMAVIWKYGTN